jgi:hypothetical protein
VDAKGANYPSATKVGASKRDIPVLFLKNPAISKIPHKVFTLAINVLVLTFICADLFGHLMPL